MTGNKKVPLKLFASLLFLLPYLAACGTLEVGIEVTTPGVPTPSALPITTVLPHTDTPTPEPTLTLTLTPTPTPSPTAEPPTVAPTPTLSPTSPPSVQWYEDRTDPIRLLASFYNGINRKEYQRAYGYWASPPNPYEQFVQGYAETASVLVAVHPPALHGVATGNAYASIPVLLSATHSDGSQHNFVGCYVARRPNVGIEGAPAGEEWSLYEATITATSGNVTDATLLTQACASLPYNRPNEPTCDDRGGPVLLLASHYDAVNRQEYRRAYGYWASPPNSYEDFAQGYADTKSVFLVVSPPTRLEGAAGSIYASIPALLIATHTDGSQHNFVGCYVVRMTSPGVTGASTEEEWSLYRGTLAPTPGNTTDVTLLARACDTQ
jgi:hypothetical protein